MGYEIERFVNKTNIDDLKCGICLEVLKEPVMISICEHIYCRECITDWLNTDNSCPEDRTPIEVDELRQMPRTLRNIYDKLEIRCDFATAGCQAIVPLCRLAVHLNDCEFNKNDCVQDCGFRGTPRQFREHNCVEFLKNLVASLKVENQALKVSNPSNLSVSKAGDFEKTTINSIIEEMNKSNILRKMKLGFRFETLTETSILAKGIGEMTIIELNNIAKIVVNVIEEEEFKSIKETLSHFRPVLERIREICLQQDIQQFRKGRHSVDETVEIPRVFLDHFERVEVWGEGNCNCHAVSIALFGDCSASEALRLLTSATLIDYEREFRARFEREFRARFDEHERKFVVYKPGYTFDDLLRISVETGFGRDKYHLIALSMAVRRPIYSYGNFARFGTFNFRTPPGANASPYDIAKRNYEADYTPCHYRFVGFEEDDNDDKVPICIYYDQFQSRKCSVLLPKHTENRVKPWKPKRQPLDYMVPKTVRR